jgi:hypothetical protein
MCHNTPSWGCNGTSSTLPRRVRGPPSVISAVGGLGRPCCLAHLPVRVATGKSASDGGPGPLLGGEVYLRLVRTTPQAMPATKINLGSVA